MTLRRWTDFVWPTLEGFSTAELADIAREEEDEIAQIRQTDWSVDTDAAIEEARRYFDLEEERLSSAKLKATNFMLFVGAIVPLLTYFAAAIWDKKTWSAPIWLSSVLFLGSCVYLLATGFWSFRALGVHTFHRVDAADLVKVWGIRKPKEALVKEIMISTRKNRIPVNKIVDSINMAHLTLRLALVWLGLLLILEVGSNVFQLHPASEANVTDQKSLRPAGVCRGLQGLDQSNLVIGRPDLCLQPPGVAPFIAAQVAGRAKP